MNTGNLALHDINGVINIVKILFSFLESVLVESIAGTLHPKPKRRGINAFPERPNLDIILFIIKAILARYPVSSNKDNEKNKINILGKNTNTEPIPEIIPLFIREIKKSGAEIFIRIDPIIFDR